MKKTGVIGINQKKDSDVKVDVLVFIKEGVQGQIITSNAQGQQRTRLIASRRLKNRNIGADMTSMRAIPKNKSTQSINVTNLSQQDNQCDNNLNLTKFIEESPLGHSILCDSQIQRSDWNPRGLLTLRYAFDLITKHIRNGLDFSNDDFRGLRHNPQMLESLSQTSQNESREMIEIAHRRLKNEYFHCSKLLRIFLLKNYSDLPLIDIFTEMASIARNFFQILVNQQYFTRKCIFASTCLDSISSLSKQISFESSSCDKIAAKEVKLLLLEISQYYSSFQNHNEIEMSTKQKNQTPPFTTLARRNVRMYSESHDSH